VHCERIDGSHQDFKEPSHRCNEAGLVGVSDYRPHWQKLDLVVRVVKGMGMASLQPAGGLRRVSGSGAASACRGHRPCPSGAAYRFLGSLLLLVASAVAAASGANAPQQYLDEETGATVFFVGRPLVFARESAPFNGINGKVVRGRPDDPHPPDMTVAPRDYVSLAAAAVDRSGKYTYVLIGYFWLVGTPQPSGNVCFDREHLVLQLGDRRIELAPFDGSARDAGISQPIHQPSIGDVQPAVYTIDLATLGLIAESSHPVLYCGAEKAPLKYDLWEDRLPALRELVRHLRD
jgi:hypothetical protein